MSDDARSDIDELTCGTPTIDLVDAGVDPSADLPEHATTCAVCQSWLAEFRDRWGAVRTEAAREIAVPGGLFDQIRDWVRNDARLFRSAVEGEYDGGRLRVAGHVLLTFLRGGLAAHDEVFPLGATLDDDAVTVEVAVEYGTPVNVIAEVVRQRAVEEYTRALGRPPQQVHVHVEDLLDET